MPIFRSQPARMTPHPPQPLTLYTSSISRYSYDTSPRQQLTTRQHFPAAPAALAAQLPHALRPLPPRISRALRGRSRRARSAPPAAVASKITHSAVRESHTFSGYDILTYIQFSDPVGEVEGEPMAHAHSTTVAPRPRARGASLRPRASDRSLRLCAPAPLLHGSPPIPHAPGVRRALPPRTPLSSFHYFAGACHRAPRPRRPDGGRSCGTRPPHRAFD